tara:strand:- start:268 stop:1461 length:1194 start_codon:yes stop_codon:yes gene_type:complete
MAATYINLPVHIPTLMRSVVEEVSDNLASDTSLSIANVTFYCETWDVLRQRLNEDGKVESLKNTRYPFIALIRGYDEKYREDSTFVESSLTLVIVARSSPNMKSEDRETENYIPILYPIYAELISVINNTRFIRHMNKDYPSHVKSDNLNLGQETPQGNIANRLPDFTDAIIVSNLQLSFVAESCTPIIRVAAKSITYLNCITSLSLTYTESVLRVTLNTATYTEAPANDTPIYSIFLSHTQEGLPVSVGSTTAFTSVGISDGSYYGYFSCDDTHTVAKLYFFYVIKGGIVISYTVSNTMSLTSFDLSGGDSTYPHTITNTMVASNAVISYRGVAENGGNVLDDYFYAPLVATTGALAYINPTLTSSGYHDEQVIIEVLSGYNETIQLENTAYYKII